MDFYLGGDANALRWGVPVMVSYGRLRERTNLPAATAPWVLDSRGFTELAQHGRWTISARDYVTHIRRYVTTVGRLVWVSPQDWPCAPPVLARTGLSEAEHQYRTTESTLLLRALDPWVRVIPVLQAKTLAGYERHADLYTAHGIDLTQEPTVGVGSLVGRPVQEAAAIVSVLAARGLRLHGFGVKSEGIAVYGGRLASADSFAWSDEARRARLLCVHGLVKWETNCREYALGWRRRTIARVAEQLTLI